ncbi:MAG: FeoB-associated Cys-rich membrane protein [Clostridia bacterium]|nr:FeoB-associated Cys-rich membrane protein [Clostridia bacterium]
MIEFILNNLGTIIVFAVVVLIVTLIIVKITKDKRAGRTTCGCGCEGCENYKYCRKNPK